MATTSYYFTTLNYSSPINTYTTGYQYADEIGSRANGGFFTAFQGYVSSGSYGYIDGRILGANGVPTTSYEIAAASYYPDSTYDAQVAGLTNGNTAVAYTAYPSGSSSGTVKVDLYQPTGTLVTSVTVGAKGDSPDVARLKDGGFVVSYSYHYSTTDTDTSARIYNADGTLRSAVTPNAGTYDTTNSVVAGLTNGNFVVAYSKETAVDSNIFQLAFRIYSASGGVVLAETVADPYGKYNIPGQAIGLADGGFAVAYQDTGWSSGDSDHDITLGIWNANGSFRTWIHANAPTGSGETGYQYQPTVTQLDNGYIVVGWSNSPTGGTEYSVWSPTGTFVTNGTWLSSSANLSFAASVGGVLSGLATDTGGDGDGYGVSSYTRALTRYTAGDATAETLVGDALRDYVTAYGGNDVVRGLGGNDTLDGGTGNDTVDGGTGNDVVYASPGADSLVGGSGLDTVSYLTSLAAVRVDLASPAANTGDAAGDRYSGFETLQGSSYNDTLLGNALANTIDGADGNDSVLGRDGNDRITGIYGNDTLDGGNGADRLDGGGNDDLLIGGAAGDALIGGSGNDTASYATAGAGVIANLASPGGNTGDAALDTYSGIENLIGSAFNDRLTGNAGANRIDGSGGNDTLDGAAGNDVLLGGTGSDWLSGGAGADQLTGGTGADRFIFPTASAAFDTIADFVHAQGDRIALASAGFGGLTSLSAGSSFIANGAPAAPGPGHTVLYNTANGWLSYDNDGSGAGAAVHFATITGHPALTTGDFVFV